MDGIDTHDLRDAGRTRRLCLAPLVDHSRKNHATGGLRADITLKANEKGVGEEVKFKDVAIRIPSWLRGQYAFCLTCY